MAASPASYGLMLTPDQMKWIYCDHNFLISVAESDGAYRDNLGLLVAAGKVQFVLSLWSLVEIANPGVAERMECNVGVVDLIKPKYARNRINIHEHEVKAALFNSCGVQCLRSDAVRPLREVVSEVNGKLIIGNMPSTMAFVGLFREHYSKLVDHFRENARQWEEFKEPKRSKINEVRMDAAFIQYVRSLMPKQAPAGLELSAYTLEHFLRTIESKSMPSILVEGELLKESRRRRLKRTDQSFMDFQHAVVGLPYADIFLTDDSKLKSLIEACRPKLPFPIARVLCKEEFDREIRDETALS